MKTTELKGVLNIKPGWLAISTTGLHEEIKNKNLKEHNKSVVFVTIQDEAKYKTHRQRKFFHKLIDIYFNTNQYDYSQWLQREPESKHELKVDIKVRLGCGIEDIPDGNVNGQLVLNKTKYIKSFAIYTKKQACEITENLMLEMVQKGIDLDNERVIYQEIYEKDIPIF